MSSIPRFVRLGSFAALALAAGISTTALAQRRGSSARSAASPQAEATAPSAAGARSGAGRRAEATARIVAAAQAVLATLDEAGKAEVLFAFDSPQRTNWSNLPSPMFQRNGLRLADLSAAQRDAVMSLLSAALSADGYRKVNQIMDGDEVLRTQGSGGRGRGPGGGGGPSFGKDQYFLAFVGTPSASAPWM